MKTVYQVNLSVDLSILDEYLVWLEQHMEEMLTFKGFESYTMSKQDADSHFQRLKVKYLVRCEADLQDYLEKHAMRMRDDGLRRFGDRFSATRDIYPYTE